MQYFLEGSYIFHPNRTVHHPFSIQFICFLIVATKILFFFVTHLFLCYLFSFPVLSYPLTLCSSNVVTPEVLLFPWRGCGKRSIWVQGDPITWTKILFVWRRQSTGTNLNRFPLILCSLFCPKVHQCKASNRPAHDRPVQQSG